jgi:hypothetical protein
MAKLLLVPALLAFGCLVAGMYGALHDQISFTASPDYFYAFKFHQFQIAPEQQNRVGAAMVGWHATWWMGVIIGVPLVWVALAIFDTRQCLKHTLIAYGVVAVTAIVFGLGALGIASLTIDENNLPNFHYPDGVANRVEFARVGLMHNFSYFGGLVGIVTGLMYLAIARWRLARRSDEKAAVPITRPQS